MLNAQCPWLLYSTVHALLLHAQRHADMDLSLSRRVSRQRQGSQGILSDMPDPKAHAMRILGPVSLISPCVDALHLPPRNF